MVDYSGFTTDLPNGLTLSVQWHDRNYAERNANGDIVSVEIACWVTDNSKKWVTSLVWPDHLWREYEVLGHISVADVVKHIDEARKYSANLVKAHQIVF